MVAVLINYWLEIFMGFIVTGFVYVFKEYVGLKNGLKALLRNEIIRIYETYSKLGYCPNYMKENAKEIYVNYHKLGGNGLISIMIQELYKMSSEKGDDKNEVYTE